MLLLKLYFKIYTSIIHILILIIDNISDLKMNLRDWKFNKNQEIVYQWESIESAVL